MLRTILLAGALVALPGHLVAQLPLVRPPPRPVPDSAPRPDTVRVARPDTARPARPDRWAAALDLGFNAATGNSRLAILSTTLRIKRLETRTVELEWSATYRYGESRGRVMARNASTTLNLDLTPRARVSPFAFTTVERDPFRRLEVRSNTGSGVKYTLRRAPDGSASLSIAGLHSYEQFTTEEPIRRDARWSVRGRFDQRLGRSVRVESTTFYKPLWDRGGDYNVQVLSKLSSKISERLALTLTHEYLYDSTPPAGVSREDQRFQAGATVEFF